MKSISGMAYFIFATSSTGSQNVPLTAKSTHAAELMRLVCHDEAVWMRRLHRAGCSTSRASTGTAAERRRLRTEMEPRCHPILCDNKGTVFTANNPSVDLNTKALSTCWRFM